MSERPSFTHSLLPIIFSYAEYTLQPKRNTSDKMEDIDMGRDIYFNPADSKTRQEPQMVNGNSSSNQNSASVPMDLTDETGVALNHKRSRAARDGDTDLNTSESSESSSSDSRPAKISRTKSPKRS